MQRKVKGKKQPFVTLDYRTFKPIATTKYKLGDIVKIYNFKPGCLGVKVEEENWIWSAWRTKRGSLRLRNSIRQMIRRQLNSINNFGIIDNVPVSDITILLHTIIRRNTIKQYHYLDSNSLNFGDLGSLILYSDYLSTIIAARS